MKNCKNCKKFTCIIRSVFCLQRARISKRTFVLTQVQLSCYVMKLFVNSIYTVYLVTVQYDLQYTIINEIMTISLMQ